LSFGFGWEKSNETDQKVIQTGELHELNDTIMDMANGEQRNMQVIKVPLKNDDGEVIQVLSVTNDITDAKTAEKLLEKQKDYLRTIIDLNPNLIFAKNKNREFTLVNKALADRIYTGE